jgi:hypothetical protein
MPTMPNQTASFQSFALAAALLSASVAQAAIKTFIIDMGPGKTISGTMQIGTLGDPIVLSAKYTDASGLSPTVVPLTDMEAHFSATRIYRGGAALVVQTFGPIAADLGLEDSFCILQWNDVETKFESMLWAPTSTPLDYLTLHGSSLSVCALFPDETDPLQTFVELPADLLLVVVEDYVTNPPSLEGYVFLPGVDGCWSLRFAETQWNPPTPTLIESDPNPVIVPFDG